MPLAFRSRWKETDDEEIESHSYANRNPIVIVYLMEQVASAEGMTEKLIINFFLHCNVGNILWMWITNEGGDKKIE